MEQESGSPFIRRLFSEEFVGLKTHSSRFVVFSFTDSPGLWKSMKASLIWEIREVDECLRTLILLLILNFNRFCSLILQSWIDKTDIFARKSTKIFNQTEMIIHSSLQFINIIWFLLFSDWWYNKTMKYLAQAAESHYLQRRGEQERG